MELVADVVSAVLLNALPLSQGLRLCFVFTHEMRAALLCVILCLVVACVRLAVLP